jgi:putative heme-binding domain-containing protein
LVLTVHAGRAFATSIICQLLATAAQHGSITAVNPYTSPSDRAAGAKTYRAQCAVCHGPEGTGTASGVDLTTGSFRHGSSEEALFQTITKGVPGTAMPGFKLDGKQTWQLITHLRALVIERSASHEKGDPHSGARLFAKLDCATCHTVSGAGGLLGPDLTRIGAMRAPAELRDSILDPNASVAPQFWTASVRTTTGRLIEGTRLNEDTHSVQMRDSNGRLLSVLKSNIAHYEILRKSPMPANAAKLSAGEFDDLLAYLTSLRGDRKAGE